MLIIHLMIAILLAFLSSYWIDCLYSLPNAPLNFKSQIKQRSKYRKIFFTACMFFFIENLPLKFDPTIIYSTVALFFLLTIIITDVEQYIIFNKMLLPFAIIALISAVHLNLNIVDYIIAGLIGGISFLFLTLITNGAIGGGDIKLIAVLGLWFGTEKLLSIIIIGSILAGISALVMLIAKIKSRQDYFAYGPYFCMAAIYFLTYSP